MFLCRKHYHFEVLTSNYFEKCLGNLIKVFFSSRKNKYYSLTWYMTWAVDTKYFGQNIFEVGKKLIYNYTQGLFPKKYASVY